MRNVVAIARRELAAYFVSPLAYVVTAAFLLISGVFFWLGISYSQSADMSSVFPNSFTIMLLFGPLLTMRLLAEEQRSGTMELLLTAPVRDFEVVMGKYLAGLGLVLAMLALTLLYPLLLYAYGNPDPGVIVSGYLGAVLFACALVAIGLFASSLTQNQVVAGVVSFAILLVLWVLDGAGSSVGGTVGSVLSYAALYVHFSSPFRGIVDTQDVVYFVSLAVAALFLTTRSLEVRRWRG